VNSRRDTAKSFYERRSKEREGGGKEAYPREKKKKDREGLIWESCEDDVGARSESFRGRGLTVEWGEIGEQET